MRYVSWFGHWLGHLIPATAWQPGHEGRMRSMIPADVAQLSSEDLFYIAMLGPHV
jgi:hypothetical protein